MLNTVSTNQNFVFNASPGSSSEKTIDSDKSFKKHLPSWMLPQYSKNDQTIRPPNLLEFRTAIENQLSSSEALNEKYLQEDIEKLSIEILYGIVSENKDTRNWNKIFNSNDIISEARRQSGGMYEDLKIEIEEVTDHWKRPNLNVLF